VRPTPESEAHELALLANVNVIGRVVAAIWASLRAGPSILAIHFVLGRSRNPLVQPRITIVVERNQLVQGDRTRGNQVGAIGAIIASGHGALVGTIGQAVTLRHCKLIGGLR